MSSPVTVGQLCSVHHMEDLLTQCPYYWKLRLTLTYRTMRYIVYLLVYTLYCYTLYYILCTTYSVLHNGISGLPAIYMLLSLVHMVIMQCGSKWSGWSGFGWTTISQGKNKIPFYKKQVINKSTRVIFGLV